MKSILLLLAISSFAMSSPQDVRERLLKVKPPQRKEVKASPVPVAPKLQKKLHSK